MFSSPFLLMIQQAVEEAGAGNEQVVIRERLYQRDPHTIELEDGRIAYANCDLHDILEDE